MSEQDQRIIAQKILAALYASWERHRGGVSLKTMREEEQWDKADVDTVIDKLKNRYGFIVSEGSWSIYDITPAGILHAEENGLVPETAAQHHQQVRTHILAYLAALYEREGSRADAKHDKIAEGAPVNRMEMLKDLSLLGHLGLIKAISVNTFRITDEGLRYYRGTDYDEII